MVQNQSHFLRILFFLSDVLVERGIFMKTEGVGGLGDVGGGAEEKTQKWVQQSPEAPWEKFRAAARIIFLVHFRTSSSP